MEGFNGKINHLYHGYVSHNQRVNIFRAFHQMVIGSTLWIKKASLRAPFQRERPVGIPVMEPMEAFFHLLGQWLPRYLIGGWALPPWKIWTSDWVIIPTIGENKIHVPNHPPVPPVIVTLEKYGDHDSGWWLVYLPLWKMMEWVTVGMMTFPIEWKNKKCSKPPTSHYLLICYIAMENHPWNNRQIIELNRHSIP